MLFLGLGEEMFFFADLIDGMMLLLCCAWFDFVFILIKYFA